MSAFRVIALKTGDFVQAETLFTDGRFTSGIDWADCLIAASAVRQSLAVATLNARHFASVRGLRVIVPY